MGSNFLAFDLGAESGRALLGTLADGRLTLEEKHRFSNPTGTIQGRLHWNLLGQWEHLKEGLRRAAGVALEGIGVDTWGVDFGLLDGRGRLLDNPMHYRDPWTEGVMEEALGRVGRKKMYEATGIQFMRFNTLFQLLAMKANRPEILERAETLLFMPDLFHYLFTGQKKSELSIASTSQMIDPRTQTWAGGLLGELGLREGILPELIPSGTVVGTLLGEVAGECGVKPVPVIASGCHDTASAVAAVPAEGEDWCYISSGTWSLMGVELDRPIMSGAAMDQGYTNELGVGRSRGASPSVRFLKNIAGLWLVQECRRQWQREGKEYSYAELTQLAEAAGSTALLDPDHGPFMLPGRMPQKIEAFCRQTGQPPPATHGEFVRCCLESLALTYRRTLEGLEGILGRRLEIIHVVGGGSQNGLLNQMTADACGRTVLAGPVEATAIGNILTQAIAGGKVADRNEARAVVRASFPLHRHEPGKQGAWDEAFGRYGRICGGGEPS
jgi:sugar (pentulose or hexulose) kinase